MQILKFNQNLFFPYLFLFSFLYFVHVVLFSSHHVLHYCHVALAALISFFFALTPQSAPFIKPQGQQEPRSEATASRREPTANHVLVGLDLCLQYRRMHRSETYTDLRSEPGLR